MIAVATASYKPGEAAPARIFHLATRAISPMLGFAAAFGLAVGTIVTAMEPVSSPSLCRVLTRSVTSKLYTRGRFCSALKKLSDPSGSSRGADASRQGPKYTRYKVEGGAAVRASFSTR